MVSLDRLQNYLVTVKIEPQLCRGFEDEAFQALFGLVNFAQAPARQRTGWLEAVSAARSNTSGTLSAGPSNKSFFYSAVLNRKNAAFGSSQVVPPSGSLDAGQFPWALNDATFAEMNAQVKQGRGPADSHQASWDSITDEASKWQKDHGLSTPAAGFGAFIVATFIKRYVPKLAALALDVNPWAAASVPAAGYVVNTFNNWTIRVNSAAAKANFAVDETRRSYDAANPLTALEVASLS